MLENLTFTDDDVNSIIKKNITVYKAHRWDNISIWMVKHCGKSIALTLRLIFQATVF